MRHAFGRIAFLLVALLAVAAGCGEPAAGPGPYQGTGGDGGGGGGTAVPEIPRFGAYDVTLALEVAEGGEPPPGGWPGDVSAKLAFAQVAAGKAQVILAPRWARTLGSVADAEFEPPTVIARNLSVPVAGEACAEVALEIDELLFAAKADGSVSGTAHGRLVWPVEDGDGRAAFEATLTGNADLAVPDVDLTDSGKTAPLDPFTVPFREPVRLGPGAKLTVDGVELPATLWPLGRPVWEATVKPAGPIEWSKDVTVHLAGAVDLAGRTAADLQATRRIRPRPSRPPAHSFADGSLDGYSIDGSVRLYDGGLPALGEDRWFAVGDVDDRFRLHFSTTVPDPAQPVLRLWLRGLDTVPGGRARVRIRVGAGTTRFEQLVDLPAAGTDLGGSGIFVARGQIRRVSDPVDVTVPLATVRNLHAYFEIASVPLNEGCFSHEPEAAGVLLDGLRIENGVR